MALNDEHKVYKTFKSFRTALRVFGRGFFVFYFCVLLMPMAGALAASTLFTVENITVDVSAENALKAREKAFEEAQVKAFEELAARMLSEAELPAFQTPALLTISPLVQDYEVSDEKLSSKRYSGTYKFRFKDQAVRRHFSKQGAEYTDIASKPLLVLPFLETDQGPILWSHQNAWMKAWGSVPSLSGGLVPLLLPLGDLTDVADIGDDEALTYNKHSLSSMVRRYNASEAVIAIARSEGTALSVQIYRTDRAQPEYVHQILERALPGQAAGQIYERAVQSVRRELRKEWKQKTVASSAASQQNIMHLRAGFSSLQEWSDLQRALSRVSGVSTVNLKALSPREAYLDVSYNGDFERLKLALQQVDLYLSAPRFQPVSAGRLNSDYSQGLLGANGGQSAIYDVRMGRGGIRTPLNYSPPSASRAPLLEPSAGDETPYKTQF